ncbi:hypothetical protein HYN48_11675 [Flavobacterium magnum]|uniref:Uncharacterized protein n=1 Tax=Flavobacterium magnum TaxID=2162713 RepID=A0A2S0RIZ1_9FLAO|nr:hypothetical protein HYN48_11675 [Flavobacterium magnum]
MTGYFYPFPDNVSADDPEAMRIYMESIPAMAAVLLLAGYAVGAFFGGLVASAISKRARQAVIVGIVLTVANIANVVTIPHPLWLSVVSTIVFLPFAWLGGKAAKRNTATIY